MQSSLKNMVVVLSVVTLLASAAVGGVFMATKPIIDESKVQKFKESMQQVLPAFEEITAEEKVAIADGDTVKVYRALSGGNPVGYAVETYALGFTENIVLLAGFDKDLNICKVAVLSQAETPGLGAKIADPQEKFVVQFEGKNPETFRLIVKKDGGDVDAITASTITSRAYSLALQRAYDAILKIK